MVCFVGSDAVEIAGEEGFVSKRVVLSVLGCLLLAAGVSAQEGLRDRDRSFSASQEISSELRRARFRSGPFYLLSSINLGDIGFDQAFGACDNLFIQSGHLMILFCLSLLTLL